IRINPHLSLPSGSVDACQGHGRAKNALLQRRRAGRAGWSLYAATRCRLMKTRGCAPKTSPATFHSRSARAPRHLCLKRAADVDRGRSREAPRGVARMAPGSREKLAGARLHEDGGRARADRAGDRALAAAGADEIAPGSCAAPGGARSGLANALIPADSSPRYPAKRPWLERGSNAIRRIETPRLHHAPRRRSDSVALWLMPGGSKCCCEEVASQCGTVDRLKSPISLSLIVLLSHQSMGGYES